MWRSVDAYRSRELLENFSIYKFKSLADILLLEHLRTTQYELGIQGGTGIFKKCHISLFSDGILNFHPGELPLYRGCSAPEYQRVDGKPVVSSCHYIDELIDTGDVVEKRILKVDMSSHYAFRGSIYPLTSQFMADVISRWLSGEEFNTQPQDERLAVYHKYIGDSAIDELMENWTRV